MCRLIICMLVALLATPVFAQVVVDPHASVLTRAFSDEDRQVGHLIAACQSSSAITDFQGGAAAFVDGTETRDLVPRPYNSIYVRTFAEIKEVAVTNTVGGFAHALAVANWTDTVNLQVPFSHSPLPMVRIYFYFNGIRTITPTAFGHGDPNNYSASASGAIRIYGDVTPNAGQHGNASVDPINGFKDVVTGVNYFDLIPQRTGDPTLYKSGLTFDLTSSVTTDFSHSVLSDYSHSFYLTGATLVDGRPLSDEGITLWFDSQLEVPEPSTLLLVGIGAISLLSRRKARSHG